MVCAGFGILLSCGAAIVALFVASALLRAGVGLANRAIGPVKADSVIAYGDWDSDDEDDVIVIKESERGIPEPGIGRGMVIMFLMSLVSTVVTSVVKGVIDQDDHGPLDGGSGRVVSAIIGAAAGFVALMGLLAWTLPTTPKRAAAATLFTFLITISIAVLIYGLVSLLLR